MKKIIATAVVLIALQAVGFAEETPHMRFNAALDYFAVGDFKDAFEKDTSDGASALASAGFSGTGQTTTHAALGARAGILFPMKNDFYVGGTVGFIGGLDAKQTLTATNGSDNESVTSETKVHFFRFLFEGEKKIAMSDQWGFNLGAGLGLANGHADIDSTASGFINASSDKSKSWTGFT